MDNDELLLKIKDMFDTKVDEVKRHMEVIVENLESKVQIVAEGHDILNRKIDTVDKKIDAVDKKVDAVDKKVEDLKRDMVVVKDYIIGVDTKLNEHEIILKRVK
ncbi:MAG TPA: hypothetical protein VIK78_03390 [Ruminiclostridium sp.]